jgi:hypothetical protein
MSISIYFAHRYFKKTIELSTLARMLAGGLLIFLLSAFFPPKNFIFILWSLLLTAAYLLFLYFARVINKNDLEVVRSIISRKKKEEVTI